MREMLEFKISIISCVLLITFKWSLHGQEKINFGIGGKLEVLGFSSNYNNVSTSPLYGITFHVDAKIKSKLLLKSSVELNNVTVDFPHNVGVSNGQIAFPILVSYQAYENGSWSAFVEGGPYFNHFTSKIDIENGDYIYLGYSYKLQSSNVIQDKFYLNYGYRLGCSVKKQFVNKTSLNFGIHYVKSIRNTNSLYYEYRMPIDENGVTSHNYTRNTFDFIQSNVQCGLYFGFGFKRKTL